MKISKRNLLALSGLFTVMGLCLMTVSIADRQLYIDLNHAVQYMGNVKFVSTGSKDFATLKQTGSGSVKITTPNFILTQTGIDKENIILTGSNSTILGGIKNTIDGSGENVIFGGSENSIKGEYNVILGGEGNSIEDNKTASVILGGKNNRVEGENVVVLGSNNTIENDGDNSKYSIIVGMSGYLKGKNSAALGLNSKVEANNSFLWNDGNGTEKLMGNNLFAVIASSGMIINTGKAHNLAKLTLGGPLIISSRDNDKNIKCGTGNGGGILKVVNSENQLCLCSCDGSGRNSMLGKGVCMSICDSSMKPECGTIVTRIVTGGFVNYSGSCDFGRPIKGPGAYLVTKDNKVHRSCQTDDGQVVGCSGTASNLPYNNCGGTHPEGEGVIIGGSSFIQGYWEGRGLTTWSYTGVLTPLTCEWTCDTTKGYHLSEDGTSCINTYSCRGTVQLTGTIRGSSTTTNPNQEWSYTESSTPGSCEWTCDSANNYYRNGEICVRGYSCAGEAPGANTIPGSNTTTNPNQEWSYTGSSTPGSCEWTCDTTKGYHLSEDGTSCTNTYSCRGTVQLTGTIRGSSTTTNPNQEWSYTESSTPGSCEWTCDSANNYYRNGEICIRGYSCAGEAPGANTIPGSNTTTNPNQEWSYTESSTPGSCEWTCETGYILDPEGNFCTPESSTCSSQHFLCKDGTEGSNQNTGDIEWTWKCGEGDCKECRTDLGYKLDFYGNCIQVPSVGGGGECCPVKPSHAIKVLAAEIEAGHDYDALLCGTVGYCVWVNPRYTGVCRAGTEENCEANPNCDWVDVHSDGFTCESGYVYREDCTCSPIGGGGGGGGGTSCTNICNDDFAFEYDGACYKTCFTSGTKITMADRSQKNIEDVRIGEKVLGSNGMINTVLGYDRPVLGERHLWSINGSKYFVSDEHPFMTTKGRKSFNPEMTKLEINLNTTELKVGDILITENGQEKIESVDYIDADYNTPLYNLILDGDHTYYANSYLVHNKSHTPGWTIGGDCSNLVPRVPGGERMCCPSGYTHFLDSYGSCFIFCPSPDLP